jgi:hypothetical protein
MHVNPHLQVCALIREPPTTVTACMARDAVLVAKLADGGLLSHVRAAGTLMHTLNTLRAHRMITRWSRTQDHRPANFPFA